MFTILVGGLSWAAVAQNVALKTNLLYWSTVTPNLGLEASIARKHTVQLFYGLNPWEPSGGESLKHWVVQPEYRYWFCEAFNGWFLGVHLMGGECGEKLKSSHANYFGPTKLAISVLYVF